MDDDYCSLTNPQTKPRRADMKTSNLKITVTANKFHGGRELYCGSSIAQAIRAARKADCSGCMCGGPDITRADGFSLIDWHAAKPFHAADNSFWYNGETGEVEKISTGN